MRPAPPSPFGIVPAEVAMDARLSLQQCQRALLGNPLLAEGEGKGRG